MLELSPNLPNLWQGQFSSGQQTNDNHSSLSFDYTREVVISVQYWTDRALSGTPLVSKIG